MNITIGELLGMTLATIIVFTFFVLLFNADKTNTILEIGDCVHETAQSEGMSHLPAEEQWKLLAEYCR